MNPLEQTGAGASFRVPPPPIHLSPLRATVCAETVARQEWRTSSCSRRALPLSLCTAPALHSVQGGRKGGMHPTPCSRTCTPVAYPLPISYPFTHRSCAQTRGGGRGGAALGLHAPFVQKRGRRREGGPSRAVLYSCKRVQGLKQKGGLSRAHSRSHLVCT